MRKIRNVIFYISVIGGLSALIYLTIYKGAALENTQLMNTSFDANSSSWSHFIEGLIDNVKYPLAILLLQIITIILVARIFGYFCKKIGQPSVIGEIVAGIFLGPSIVGYYFPEFSVFLFPESSLGNLGVMSQIGLILFMFVVGMELDLKVLRNQAHEAVVISHASIIFPFALGVLFAYFIYESMAPEGINFISFALFIGISMSITAFPVLARIVQERGLTRSRLGSIVITCAAADDITAWCILAAVIAIVKAGSFLSAGYTILLAVAYVFVMLRFVRPFLRRIGDIYTNKEALSKPIVGIFFVTLLLSAWCTEVIGIHALFGAFMAGVIMPANVKFRNVFVDKVEDVALVLLLPLFFVFTGLRTQIGLLNEPGMWKLCIVVILVAVTGKFLGSALAARFVGQNWHSSLTIGALMNTRGLMELVALNIGYDLGVLSPEMFAMLVLMALITTFMTGPALDLINKLFNKEDGLIVELSQKDKYNILISFGNPLTGKLLVRLANALIRKSKESATITALHLSPGNELTQFNAGEYERESFAPIKEEANHLDQPVISLFKPSQNIDEEIVETANEGDFDLLLIGIGQSVFEGTFLGKILGFTTRVINPERLYGTITGKENPFAMGVFDERTKQLLRSTKIPTGILIDKKLQEVKQVIVPIFSLSDSFLLIYIQKLIHNGQVKVTLLDIVGTIKQDVEFKESIRAVQQVAPDHLVWLHKDKMDTEILTTHDLMVISLSSWKRALETRSVWLSKTPSVLIMKPA
ncbi:cation:proton antiporter [Olivibacter sp. SDN3]|uniref:cation:proton antiporter domain-containing protein n=1 Tax=Olivibacter sp. SDN3 TaxID=2764720 RepID=UPI001651A388|nr:cation:proton antiporter [Olivibacter sp. SDN3]QNL50176.1 cation:proton antiporter [Olivibacter sp. SDN3]